MSERVKHLEWRQFYAELRTATPEDAQRAVDMVWEKWGNADDTFRVTNASTGMVPHPKEGHGVLAARFVCDYIAKGANAGDVRKRFADLLGKHLKPTGMEVENLAMIRVNRAQWPLPTKQELNGRWKPAPFRAQRRPGWDDELG